MNTANVKPTTQTDYETMAAATFGVPATTATAIVAGYPLSSYSGNPELALTAAGTDLIFACANRKAAGDLAAAVPTYAYEFKDQNAPQVLVPPPPADPSFPYHAAHASELQYLFTLPTSVSKPLSADQQALSATMVKFWTEFAKTGNPNPAGSATWPAYAAASDTILTLDTPAASVQPTTAFKTDHKCTP
jgi:para-nitrobenzyl esterase